MFRYPFTYHYILLDLITVDIFILLLALLKAHKSFLGVQNIPHIFVLSTIAYILNMSWAFRLF